MKLFCKWVSEGRIEAEESVWGDRRVEEVAQGHESDGGQGEWAVRADKQKWHEFRGRRRGEEEGVRLWVA